MDGDRDNILSRRATGRDDEITRVILWCASLTALFTAAALIILMRVFGLLSFAGTVNFRGSQRSIASVQKVQQVWDALSGDFYMPVDEDRMLEYAAKGMADSIGDVYTSYYSKDEMRRFSEHSAGIFHGIGVYVLAGENGRLRVTGFLEGSPALEAGVMKDDEVVSVDGVDVSAFTDSGAVINMIMGEAGVSVKVGFYRPSDDLVHEFEIVRKEIKTENIFSGTLYIGPEANIPVGYIYIKMFDGAAYEYFEKHLNLLLEAGIAALVIDLRGNPGGDFKETVKIADRLIGEGVITYTEDRAGRREYSNSDARALGLPIRALIDAGSASSSEILAGAIKDSGAGRLVGTGTFGKGLVQAVLTLKDGSGLKYTRSRFFTPSGVCINGDGIEPDIFAELSGQGESAALPGGRGYDSQIEAALSDIEIFIDKATYE